MSSESDNDAEFYDALEITPNRLTKHEDTTTAGGEVKASSSPIFTSQSSSQNIPKKKVASLHLGSPSFSTDYHHGSTYIKPMCPPEQTAQSLLQSLETTSFTKEKSTEMPPPSDPPPSVERLSLEAANRQKDYEESSSACSGSLLGNLGDDDEEIPKERLNRRRHRHKEVQRKMNKEDEGGQPMRVSPAGSQSSSLDGVYPGKTSHPFRVVEMDNASVYSSMSLGKIGKMHSGIEIVTTKDEQIIEKSSPLATDECKDISAISEKAEDSTVSTEPTIINSESSGLSLCPEPDLVASTRSSSGSDKSNSLPRTDPDTLPVTVPLITSSAPSIVPLPNTAPSLDHKKVIMKTQTTAPFEDDVIGKTLPVSSQVTSSIITASITCKSTTTTTTTTSINIAGVTASTEAPVAPPRRRRRAKQANNGAEEDTTSLSSSSSLPLSHINTNVDKISIGHSLDLRAAVRGDYLVKPQDSENAKALGPSPEQVAEAEVTSEATSQASTPEISRALVKDKTDHQPDTEAREQLTPDNNIDPRSSPTITNTSHSSPQHSRSSESATPDSTKPRTSSPESPVDKQLNMPIRTRSDSGKELSDVEILQQISVLNLDTGQRIPLSEAEQALPEALNPLSLHIMRITSEYVGTSTGDDNQESDDESVADILIQKLPEIDANAVKKKTFQFKKFLGRKVESAVNKAKSLAQEVSHRHKEEKDVFEDDTPAQCTMQYVKIKTSHSHKGPHEFDNLLYVQEITGEQKGPVWCMKFSGCGQLLATAGQDHVLRVWVLKTAFNYFLDIRNKCNADIKVSPTPSQESLVSQHSGQSGEDPGSLDPNDDGNAPFMPKPFCVYSGHSADMLDISWSKNYFMLTSSMDKTVRLWHISRKECLCIFQHMDFVTAIAFHPKDDRYFISGSLDGKLRLWSIPDKRVVLWNEVDGQSNLITAANFCQNGLFTVVGTYDGRCIFYETDQLKYHTTIHVRSTRGKNAKGRKITGIEPLPGEDKVLITSNDSRIRLYDLRDLNLSCKYKGYSNVSSQIRAGFSHDGKFIVAGSENQCIYIWKTYHDYSKFSSARRDRNGYWEGVKAHSAVVTCSVFAPHPELVFDFIEKQETKHAGEQPGEQKQQSNVGSKDSNSTNKGYVLVSADFIGCIKVFLKREKPKHSSLPASALA